MSELTPRIPLDMEKIEAFCKKWQIVEFSLFGSVLTDEFRPDSDVDVMVKFALEARVGMLAIAEMEEELSDLVGRNVDLTTRKGVENTDNYLIRRSILSGARTFYAA